MPTTRPLSATDFAAEMVALDRRSHERAFKRLAGLIRADPDDAMRIARTLLGKPETRPLAAAMLGQVSTVDEEHVTEVGERLVGLLDDEDADVLEAAIIGLGHAASHGYEMAHGARTRILALGRHRSVHVRGAVARALPFPDHEEEALDLLRGLSADRSADVRDWATFGLANSEARDEATVSALVARLDDRHRATRIGAIDGLALRGHPLAKDAMEREIARGDVDFILEEAARLVGVAIDGDDDMTARTAIVVTAGILDDHPDWPEWQRSVRGRTAAKRLAPDE